MTSTPAIAFLGTGRMGLPMAMNLARAGFPLRVRAVIAWQATLTSLIAVGVGGPLGIIGGRLAWHDFARSLGVVPIVEIPVPAFILGLAAPVLAGNLLAALPATVAARTRPGAGLRAE